MSTVRISKKKSLITKTSSVKTVAFMEPQPVSEIRIRRPKKTIALAQVVEEQPSKEENLDATCLSHLGKYVEEPYSIIESYFYGKHLERLVRHQIESYNHFINYQVLRTIAMFNPVTVRSENDYVELHDKYLLEVNISFANFKLYPPQIHENNGATRPMLPC